jgi:hypothetical protein
MLARVAFLFIALFWATMNILLWRAEYGNRDVTNSSVSVAAVWRKILTAPDPSALNIFYHGEKVGFCHWQTSVGEELAKLDEAPPEGILVGQRNYHIRLEGNVSLRDFESRLRFDSNLTLATNQSWQELKARLSLRPTVWELQALAVQQTVRLKADDGETHFERVMRFSDLANPNALLGEFSGPFSLAVFGGLPATTQKSSSLISGLHWTARYDTLTIGHEPVKVYRLETRLLDRYPVIIFVSRAGEILRAELPDKIVLVLEQLGGS